MHTSLRECRICGGGVSLDNVTRTLQDVINRTRNRAVNHTVKRYVIVHVTTIRYLGNIEGKACREL